MVVAEGHRHDGQATGQAVRELPPIGANERDRDFAINELIRGRGNHSAALPIVAGTTSTVVAKPTINDDAVVQLTAGSQAAATAMSSIFVSQIGAGQFTVEHPAFTESYLTDDALATIYDDAGVAISLGAVPIVYYSVIGG